MLRFFLTYPLILCFNILLIGCSSTVVYYSADADPQVPFDPQDTLGVYYGDNPTISDKKFALLLGEIMAEEGYNVSGFNTDKNPVCRIFFSQDISSSSSVNSYTTNHTSYNRTYIPGTYSSNGYNPGRTITTTTTTPITHYYTKVLVTQNVGVSVMCKIKDDNNFTQLWFGYFSAELDNYKSYQKDIIRFLVSLLGRELEGQYINLSNIISARKE
ncbi:hypothetical protein [Helicobacter trogontum]|uniref:DUF4136 domain-containing protein n=1 Tax=Helicobacter trogontum TaxID=50960 RepID=A0A4U8S8Z7_9HELI|nr:hypothetical protein [Helicobacter trogontum]TLD82473.1 hypothetical protein LS81_008035 [Helicobacter trogontum]